MDDLREYLRTEIDKAGETIFNYERELGLLRKCKTNLSKERPDESIKQLLLFVEDRISNLSGLKAIAEKKKYTLLALLKLVEGGTDFQTSAPE